MFLGTVINCERIGQHGHAPENLGNPMPCHRLRAAVVHTSGSVGLMRLVIGGLTNMRQSTGVKMQAVTTTGPVMAVASDYVKYRGVRLVSQVTESWF